MPFVTGQVLEKRYRIVRLLGQGGFGAVYRAWDTRLNIPMALKENLDSSQGAQRQFEREASMLARLQHPNLPRVTDYFFIPGQGQYLVMDFIEGQNLEWMVNEQGALLENQLQPWIEQVCQALAYLHAQNPPIIHRDIKPANIIVRADGRAMLVDFGIAKVYDARMATTIGAKAVTPGYSPPEQYGGGKTDRRSDIYALGATIYYTLTAQTPPESVELVVEAQKLVHPRQINSKVSREFETAILKCMQIPQSRRFQDATEIMRSISRPVETPADVQISSPKAAASSAAGAQIPPAPAIHAGLTAAVRPVKEPEIKDVASQLKPATSAPARAAKPEVGLRGFFSDWKNWRMAAAFALLNAFYPVVLSAQQNMRVSYFIRFGFRNTILFSIGLVLFHWLSGGKVRKWRLQLELLALWLGALIGRIILAGM